MPEVRPGARLDALGRPLADDEPGPARQTDSLGRILPEDGSAGATMPGVGQQESPAPPTATLPTGASGEALLIPHSSGVSGAPLGQVRMDMDALRTFANRDLKSIYDEAQSLVQKFDELPVHAGMFSQAVLPSQLAHQLVVIRDVLGAGLRGVLADIDRFGENLRKTADNHKREDEAAEDRLMRAMRKFTAGPSEATSAFDAAVTTRTDPAPAASSTQPAAAQPAAAAPAAAAPSAGSGDGGTRSVEFQP